jgi:uncharacterized protein with GYD domain
MATYVILSRISPDAFKTPGDFRRIAEEVAEKIRKECPSVMFKQSYSTLGRFDFVDIVEADDPKQVEKASMIIRSFGHSVTETMMATPWKEFLQTL